MGAHSDDSCSVAVEVLERAIRQEIEIKGIKIENEKVKQSLFTLGIILYLENPKASTEKVISNLKILDQI